MYTILLVIHVLICISLIISVLLQSSKGGGLGGAFGAGSSNTLFGSEGASSFLKKATKVLGVSFMVMTVLLALSSGQQKTTKDSSGISSEVQEEIDKSKGETQEPPAELPEGFERLPQKQESEKQE